MDNITFSTMAILLEIQLLKVWVGAAWTRVRFSWEPVHQLDRQVGLRPGQRQETEEEPQKPVGEQQTSLWWDLPAVLSLVSHQTGWYLYCFASLWRSQHLGIQSTVRWGVKQSSLLQSSDSWSLSYLFLLSGYWGRKTVIIARQVKTNACNLMTPLLIILASHHYKPTQI